MEANVTIAAEPGSSTEDMIILTDVNGQPYEGSEVEVTTGEEGRVIPGRSRAADTVCLEPCCDFRCSRIPKLRDHLSSVHGFLQPVQTFRFATEEEFQNWMSKIESENHCSYMRRRGWQTNKNQSRTACYYCNRGGVYVSNASKKQSKQQGTCKTGVECTSSVKVTMWSSSLYKGLIEVEAYLQHYGHNFDLGHTRIHWHDRKLIEEKLKSGISRHKILDEIRGSLDQTSDLNRMHLISLQDIYNIEKRCGIKANRGRYCSEAGITAQAWIEAMQQSEENPVLLIKYQQEAAPEKHSCLAEDDFLLILQTPLQLKMLQKHGPRQFMCIDITQGSSANDPGPNKEGHEFQLFALEVLIPDENQSKGPYPVAWCVSNRKDGEIVKVFFSCVKENLGGFTLTPGYLFIPSAGVTNHQDWFGIWCNTFGAGPRRLIASWHVLEEWRQNLQALAPAVYTSASERGRVMANLETVIRESSVEHFSALINECVTDLKTNIMTTLFSSYFERTYMSQAELWASAYRTDAANSADAHLSAFHVRLSKHIYQEALKRKQLDILVKTLMKYTRDNVLPKLRTLHKGKNEFHQRAITAATHKETLELPLEQVTQVEGENYQWNVISTVDALDEATSHIRKIAVQHTVAIKPQQPCTARLRCPLRCADCAACPHQMTCTCSANTKIEEAAVLANEDQMCVHMHQLCRFLFENYGLKVDGFVAIRKCEMTGDVIVDDAIDVQETNVMDVIVTTNEGENCEENKYNNSEPPIDTCNTTKHVSCKNEIKRRSDALVTMAPEGGRPIKIIKLENMASGVVFVPANMPVKIVNRKVS